MLILLIFILENHDDIQTPSEETTTCFIKGREYTHVHYLMMNRKITKTLTLCAHKTVWHILTVLVFNILLSSLLRLVSLPLTQ